MEKMARKFKGLMVDEVAEMIKNNPHLFFLNFQKVPASKTEKLRRSLKKSSSEFKVLKRSVVKLALKKRKMDDLCAIAEQSCAITFVRENPARTSKILFDFSRSEENMVITGGYVEGEILAFERIKELAMLPPREVLLAMVIGGMKSPMSGFANVLRGNLQKLVYALNAIYSAAGGAKGGENK
jgi:large subunit ribosomal protein L10